MTDLLLSPAAALAGLAATIALLATARRRPAGPARPRAAGAVLAGALALFVAGGLGALGLDGVPYNVRELFAGHPLVSLALTGTALLLLGAVPHLYAYAWERDPARAPRRALALVPAASALAFALLAFAAPAESLDDVVGSPVLGIPRVLERGLRFVGLLLAPLALANLGARAAGPRPRRADLPAAAVLLALASAGWVVVVPLACTDNLTELLRSGGYDPRAVLGTGALGALAGGLSAALARRTPMRALAALACSLPASWGLFVLATEPALTKYGRTFSARQFLLSPGRDDYLPDPDLAARFAAVWLAAVLGLALVAAAVRLGTGPPDADGR